MVFVMGQSFGIIPKHVSKYKIFVGQPLAVSHSGVVRTQKL